MKQLRVVVLTHEDLVPPESLEGLSPKQVQPIKTEFAVAETLEQLGHQVHVLGVSDDLMPIRRLVEGWEADVVFNLLMEFQDVGAYQAHVVSYLELLRVPYTGCNSLGIQLSRDKALSKKILLHHRIPTARFTVLPRGRAARGLYGLRPPLIVKSVDEEASLGISQASVVTDAEKLRERVAYIHEHVGSDAIAEEYVEGREMTVSVLGNDRLTTFPPWELHFDSLPEGSLPIATARAKFDVEYQKRVGLRTGAAKGLSPALLKRIDGVAKRVYRELGLSGYARLDLRITPEEQVYVIEANATPDIAADEDFAEAAEKAGIDYPHLIQRILNLALAYQPRWKTG